MHKISDEFGQIGLVTTELAALECLKISYILKWCLHTSSFIFDRIISKVASNQDKYKSSAEFGFEQNQVSHF